MKAQMFITLIIGIVFLTLAASKPFLHVKNHKIYDENGGERIFHGVNLVAK
jgi:hypothetical protein